MWVVCCGLAISFVLGFLLEAIVLLTAHRQKIIAAVKFMRGWKSGEGAGILDQVGAMFGQVAHSLCPAPPDIIALRCGGPAFEGDVVLGLPWGQVELPATAAGVTFEIKGASLHPAFRADGQCRREIEQVLKAAAAAMAENSESYLLLCGKGPLFLKGPISVSLPWGEENFDLSQAVGIPVVNGSGKGTLVRSGPSVLYQI